MIIIPEDTLSYPCSNCFQQTNIVKYDNECKTSTNLRHRTKRASKWSPIISFYCCWWYFSIWVDAAPSGKSYLRGGGRVISFTTQHITQLVGKIGREGLAFCSFQSSLLFQLTKQLEGFIRNSVERRQRWWAYCNTVKPHWVGMHWDQKFILTREGSWVKQTLSWQNK